MTKFSFIIPVYGDNLNQNIYHSVHQNLRYTIESLLNQTFKDFEIIICGVKILDKLQIINGITIKNIILHTNKMGKLVNKAHSISNGEYVHLWSNDLIVYPDYLERLNNYISQHGNNCLYAGKLIDTRSIGSRDKFNVEFFENFYYPEAFFCMYKKHFEPFNEEFEGYVSHWCQEFLYRMWEKLTFRCLNDLYVVHIPHSLRLTKEQQLESSYKSAELFERLKRND